MKNKNNKRMFLKVLIIVLGIIVATRLFGLILAKYESISNSNANLDIAFYLLKEDYQTMTTNLASIEPRDNAYVFNFSIGNQDGTQTAEVDLEYELTIRTTTNLPLTYELYMNQQYTDSNAQNIITENKIEADEQGTYFRKLLTDKVSLSYKVATTNQYQLVVHFPKEYNTENYQDIIELIEITVDSHQVIGKES